jgi:hypothetical protein
MSYGRAVPESEIHPETKVDPSRGVDAIRAEEKADRDAQIAEEIEHTQRLAEALATDRDEIT